MAAPEPAIDQITLNGVEATSLLDRSPETAKQLAASGELPATKFGHGWIFIRDDLLAVIRTRYPKRWRWLYCGGAEQAPRHDDEVSVWNSHEEEGWYLPR